MKKKNKKKLFDVMSTKETCFLVNLCCWTSDVKMKYYKLYQVIITLTSFHAILVFSFVHN